MEKIADSLTDLIGKTPLLRLNRYSRSNNLHGELIAKLEYFNPLGSVKDRIAYGMIDDAERRGVLVPGATIIEPTSGNTGIGLAFVAAAKGYKIILVMPETNSMERRRLLRALGDQLVVVDKQDPEPARRVLVTIPVWVKKPGDVDYTYAGG